MLSSLLLATTNQAKIHELTHGLTPLVDRGVKLITLDMLNSLFLTRSEDYSELVLSKTEGLDPIDEPDETGATFTENADLKARYYAKATLLPTLADDGGLTINALDGAPGVHSKRWLGYESTDEEKIAYTLEKMKGVPDEKRGAQLTTVLCFTDLASDTTIVEEGSIRGHIAHSATTHYRPGFPYRGLFVVNEYGKYYDELSEEQHTAINHRRIALSRLIDRITERYF